MPSGLFLVREASIEEVEDWLTRYLKKRGYRLIARKVQDGSLLIKFVSRSSLEAFLWSRFVPFGRYMRRGQRVGVEAKLSEDPRGVLLNLLVTPYMELLNLREVFLLSQGIVEKIIDDSYSVDEWRSIVAALQSELGAERVFET